MSTVNQENLSEYEEARLEKLELAYERKGKAIERRNKRREKIRNTRGFETDLEPKDREYQM